MRSSEARWKKTGMTIPSELNRVFAILAILLSSCGSPPSTPEEILALSIQDLRAGRLVEALNRSQAAQTDREADDGGYWYWRFQLFEAEVHIAQGRYKEALVLLEHDLSDDPRLRLLEARRRMHLGNAYRRLSEYDQAERLLAQAHEEAEDRGDVGLQVEIEVRQGGLLWRLRRTDDAERVLESARQLSRRIGDRYHEGASLNTLGLLRFRRARWDSAVPYFERALDASRESRAELLALSIRNNLAICLGRLGEFDRARSLYEETIEVTRATGADFKLQNNLGSLANLYFLEGRPAQALPHYREALEVAQRIEARTQAALWSRNLAGALIQTGEWDAAERANKIAASLQKSQDQQVLAFATLNASDIALGRNQHAEAARLFRETIEAGADRPSILWAAYAGLGKVYADLEDWSGANLHFSTAIQIIEKAASERQLKRHEMAFFSRLIRFYQDFVEALVNLDDPAGALSVAEGSRARVLGERLSLPGPARKLIDYQAAARESDTIFLSYWLAPIRSFLWVVKADGIQLIELPGEEHIAESVEAYRHLVEGRKRATLDSPQGKTLFEMLVKPAGVAVGSRVVLVPDGILHRVNFETLPVLGESPHYWIEDVTLSIAPSLNLLSSDGRREDGSRPKSILLLGDPDVVDPTYPELPFASQEISSIRNHLSSGRIRMLQGAEANPVAFLEAEPRRFSHIHFTAHAEPNPSSPLESAVILSRSPESESFKLYARDLQELDLETELVTISACKSAGARAYAGEGLVGFAWAFLHSGARRIVAGLWDVSDDSGAALMDGFYGELASGKGPADALRESKLSLLRSGHPNFVKPYYWGAFQAYVRVLD